MRKYGILAVLAALALSACGGGSTSLSTGASASSSSSSSSSGGTINKVQSITLISSVPQLPSDNSAAASITAIVKNASNAVVPSADVVFSTSTGVIAPVATSATGSVAGVSDTNGEAQATLTTPGDPSNRVITVTATVGTVSSTIAITVAGTKLVVSGATSLIVGGVGNYSAALTDSGGNGIAATAVAVASANGNTLSSANLTTDTAGHVNFTVTAAKSGNDTITVSALGLSATAPLSVSSQTFSIKAPAANASVALGAPQAVTVVWTNNGAPVASQPVTFSTTRGLFTGNVTTIAGTTDSTGTATASISSTLAGPATITIAGAGVSAQVTIFFIATNPTQIDVQASPDSIQTSAQSTITAIVRDAQLNLVQGQTVDFQLTDKTGGTISVASAVTDAQGVAQTVYTATIVQSAQNGVLVTATIQGTAIQNSVTLTVGGQTVFLSLGTGNTISAPNSTQFSMPYSVQALDASGNPVTGVTITFSVHSYPYVDVPPVQVQADGSTSATYAAYAKGSWIVLPSTLPGACNGIEGTAYCQVITATCFNEDVNGSGVLQSPSEDINGNGRLDPGDVASVSPGSIVTDSTGSGAISILYPQDHAGWVHVLLTASATVSGTESSTSAPFWLPMLAVDINTAGVPPPGAVSPYGFQSVCTNPN